MEERGLDTADLVSRGLCVQNQILVSRMDTMGSKVWALRKENRCLRAENQTLRIALDKAVTEAAHAEAGPQVRWHLQVKAMN